MKDVMISWRGQLFCQCMMLYALIHAVIPLSAPNSSRSMFSLVIQHCHHMVLYIPALCASSVCVSTSFSLLTVTESYRGLNTQRGEASSPSGQLQRRQQENQETPTSLIHPFLPHKGQRPVGRREQERGRAGAEGVQGGFQREGVVFPRGSRVWHWFLLPQQRGEHQWRHCHHKRSWRSFTGAGVSLYLLLYLTFTPCLPCVTHQSCPHTILPAGREGERGVGWGRIGWV